ncbi:TonB-dependent receptor [Oceanicaulis sp.]|uniref:TonB-dependent receptor n=1 Tax=Oceanicaulis sp. TaxID=1924941 RepID=UPI003BAB0DD6
MAASFKRIALLAAASSLTLSAASQAQVFDQVGGGERRTVDVITVTAQQREESAQDVPISIGAYDTQALANAGVRDIKDLQAIAPGLIVTSTQSETITTARIRGIGTVGDNFGLESSVGVYIDGVFRARNGVGFNDLGELERIEVLRGPQGTLFGKNTSAGVLNIVTAGPEFEPGASVEASFGDYGYSRVSAHLTGPIIEDVLAGRIFAVEGHRNGFMDLYVEDDAGQLNKMDSETQDYWSVRGQLEWTPSETVSGRLIADYTERDELCCSATSWDYTTAGVALVNSVGGQALFPADPDVRVAFSNREYAQMVQDWGLSAEFDIELPIGTLTTVTAYRTWANQRSQDIDYTSADLAYRDIENNYTDIERLSQEVRLNGQWGDLDWLVGAFYSHEDLVLGDAIRLGDDWEAFLGRSLTAGTVPPLGTPAGVSAVLAQLTGGLINIPPGSAFLGGQGVNQDVYNQTADSWAVFTHNAYRLTDNLTVTAGLRYTHENKDVYATFDTNQPLACAAVEQAFGFDPINGFIAAGAAQNLPAATIQGGATAIANICLPYARTGLDANGYDNARTDEEVSGTLRLTYDINDDVMVFGGYSRGFKAGGFNLDRQLNGPIGADGYLNSDNSFAAETVDSYEIGFKSQLFGNVVQLNGSAFFQQVGDFQLNTFNGIAFVVESIDEAETYGVELDFFYATPIEGLDLTAGYAYTNTEYTEVNTGDPLVDALQGQDFSLVPDQTFTTQVIYSRPVFDNLLVSASADARWASEYNTGSDLDPEKVQDAFTTVNARLGLGREDGAWSVELWGRNLTDETYAQVAIDAFAQGRRAGSGTSLDARGTASYAAFLGAPRTWGVTLRTEW